MNISKLIIFYRFRFKKYFKMPISFIIFCSFCYMSCTVQDPVPPSEVIASQGDFIDRVEVSWNDGDNASFYQVFRSNINEDSYSPISDKLSELKYIDWNIDLGNHYLYKIKSINNADDQSDFSHSVEGYSLERENRIWIQPRPVDTQGRGSIDFKSLFLNLNEWENSRERTHVFGFYDASFVDTNWMTWTNEEIRDILNIMESNKIFLAFETGALKEWGGNGDIEFELTSNALSKIRSAGGLVKFIKIDEPLCCAMKVDACNKSFEEALSITEHFIDLVKSYDKRIIIGDIEPYPFLRKEILIKWIQSLKENVGNNFSFFILDINYSAIRANGLSKQWDQDIKEIVNVCKNNNIIFGNIFWSSNFTKEEHELKSDYEFYKSTMAFSSLYIEKLGLPEICVIQSWGPFPKYTLPEYSGYSFTQLVRDFVSLYFPENNQ